MRLTRVLVASTILLAAASLSSAVTTKGFAHFSGVQGPSTDKGHEAWFELSHHAIDVDSDDQCAAIVDTMLREAGPWFLTRMGDTVAEVRIELTNQQGMWTYRATMENVKLEKLVSSSGYGSEYGHVEMTPASIRLDVREQEPNGQFGSAVHSEIYCAGGSR